MKSQQGFVVFAAVPFLIGATVVGGVAAIDVSHDKAIALAQSQAQATPTLAAAPADPSVSVTPAIQQTSYEGPLYRKGSYSGDKNSDMKMESIDP
jgi:hypothetical protein